jgi:hypothetical protein
MWVMGTAVLAASSCLQEGEGERKRVRKGDEIDAALSDKEGGTRDLCETSWTNGRATFWTN